MRALDGVEQLPGQLAQGVAQTVAARVVQKALPNLGKKGKVKTRVSKQRGEQELTDHLNKRDSSKDLHYRVPSQRQRRPYQTLS